MSKDVSDTSEEDCDTSSETDDMERNMPASAAKVAIEYSSGSSSSSSSSSDTEDEDGIDPGLVRKELSLLDDDEPVLIRTEIEEAGEEEELVGWYYLRFFCYSFLFELSVSDLDRFQVKWMTTYQLHLTKSH